jgi:aspartate ammonia-lyase
MRARVTTRIEHDSLGERAVPAEAYWGIQTLRAVENFPLSGILLSQFPHFVRALAMTKKACALANHDLGNLEEAKTAAIVGACDEIIGGALHDQFVVDMIQGGAGTSTNMNANEVIANRGLELLGHGRGEYRHLHPNDDVNRSQSTNDTYPTALKIGVILTGRDAGGAIDLLEAAFRGKAEEFKDVIKMGRTEEQDAVPMTLGQEFGAWAVMIDDAKQRLVEAGRLLLFVNQGATAVGTGINSPPGFPEVAARRLAEVSGLPIVSAPNLVEATQDAGEFVQMSATLKRAAVQISKICNDLRLLSSGPRCGLGEINLPPLQPGSSIMPGKVNPVIPEVVNQVCYQLIGNDITVTMAAEAGSLELNAMEPIMALNLLQSVTLLGNACRILAEKCVQGITANRDRCAAYVRNSIGVVTALNPVIGYDRAAAVAKEALATGGSVYDLVLQKGWLSRERLDELLAPEAMTSPRRLPVAKP